MNKKNTHMRHLEEVLFEGPKGLEFIKYILKGLTDKINKQPTNISLSVKIDGAPTMMLWSKFPELRDYGVGTKTVFNKEPKTSHSPEEIDKNFGDRPDLAYSLKLLLKYAKEIKVPDGQIWQGDFLFTNKTLQEYTNNVITFKPNTIRYYVNKNSDIGREIVNSEIGIIWHTRYTKDMKMHFNIDLNVHPRGIYMAEPYLYDDDINKLQKMLDVEDLKSSIFTNLDKLNTDKYSKMLEYKTFALLFLKYQNKLIKTQSTFNINDFIKFVASDKNENIAKKIQDFIDIHKDSIMLIVDLTKQLFEIKKLFLKPLNKLGVFKACVDLRSGESKSINQEGFAVSSPYGNAVKIVDRNEFSYANFSPDVIKGWEH